MQDAHFLTVVIVVGSIMITPFYVMVVYVFSGASAMKGFWIGAAFLILGSLMVRGHIPGISAYPAGIGDILAGAAASVVLLAYRKRQRVPDELIEQFTSAAKVMKVGSGLDEQSGMGPLATAAHKEKVLGYIDKGIAEGADLVMDGRDFTVDEYPNGYFVGPTLFDNVKPDMTIAKEEIFGPVVSVVRAKDLDEVINLINTRGFANAACIYTNDGATAREFKYRVIPSMVGINIGIAAPMSFFPFGGSGSSMFGDTKAHGKEIFNFFTDTKVVIQRWF